ncbi:hypothetical protein [Salisediminibacterium beveridgei]|uniref:hypothetical protein n=1 Tax=Salisediminibacterium beveridgei TaxID=632773 RepID=UPI00084817C0|nr:hypothetical protein [Salisediminibacterium beveridgei]
MDNVILSAIISASVALLIAIINHFLVTPYREKQIRRREQISTFYGPMYGIVSARLGVANDLPIGQKQLNLGTIKDKGFTEREYMESFLLNNAGYATNQLLEYGLLYVANINKYDELLIYNFITTLVKDYNYLKKKTHMEYNKEELNTGIPECVKHLREVYPKDF